MRSFDKKFEDRIGDHVRTAVTWGLTSQNEVMRFVFERMGIKPTDPAVICYVVVKKYKAEIAHVENFRLSDEKHCYSQLMLGEVIGYERLAGGRRRR